MLLGGRTTRTFKHILNLTTQLERKFIYTVTPLRFAVYTKASVSGQPRSDEHPIVDDNAQNVSIPSQPKISSEPHARLVESLNRASSDVWKARAVKGHSHYYSHRTDRSIHRDIASMYLTIRATASSIQTLQAQAYIRVAEHAEKNELQQVMDFLAQDLLVYFRRDSDPEGFSKAIAAILSHATPACPLSRQRVLELYQALTVSNTVEPPRLDPIVLQRIVKAIITHPDIYLPPLESLVPMLLSAEAQSEKAIAQSTWVTYELLMKIVMAGQESYPRALAVFQQLIQAGRIPKLVQERAEEQGGSFKLVIASALVRGCLVFNWYGEAVQLMLELLRDPRWPYTKGTTKEDVQVVASLGLEVLQALVSSSTRSELRLGRPLIRSLLPTPPSLNAPRLSLPVEIPHAILFSFYDACYTHKLAEAAASVYYHLQSPAIRAHHEYPPPRNAALWWLLDYFASPGVTARIDGQRSLFRGHLQLARSLVERVLRRGHPVPVMDRPRLIALTAARGFGLYTRQLWELYTAEDDPDRDVVRGNAQMLVRVVSLFQKSQERWDEAVERQNPKRDDFKDTVNAGSTPAVNAQGSLPRDYWRFAQRVLASFIETKEPLAMASQHDLSALARAHLILGHIPEGLQALTFIVERGDIPDLKDINVALAGMARYSPRRAARMIDVMVERGVEPTASTFGAVLHEALRDKDSELVESLIARASALGHGALTQKALASLVRSTISFEYTSDKEERIRQQQAVQRAMEAIKTTMRYPSAKGRKDHGKDHALSVNLGKDCIKAALKALQPESALRFWRLLVRDRVLWNDREHTVMRAWIARSIRDSWRHKLLGYDKASEWLQELGELDVGAD